MNNFKVGDVVKCIDIDGSLQAKDNLEVGKTYVIKRIEGGISEFCRVGDIDFGFYTRRFKLVSDGTCGCTSVSLMLRGFCSSACRSQDHKF